METMILKKCLENISLNMNTFVIGIDFRKIFLDSSKLILRVGKVTVNRTKLAVSLYGFSQNEEFLVIYNLPGCRGLSCIED